MITPTGKPAWARTNDHTAYGGHVQKVNYQGVGTVNPQTDLSAENLCRMAADLAAVARTASSAVWTAQYDDAGPHDPTISDYIAQVDGLPTPHRNGTGDARFSFAASYADPYGVSAPANIIAANAMPLVPVPATLWFPVYQIQDLDADGVFETVRVVVYDGAGTIVTSPKVSVEVWFGPNA